MRFVVTDNPSIFLCPQCGNCVELPGIEEIDEELQSSAYGSVFDTITTTTFKEHEVSLPPRDEIIQFDNSVSGFFEKMLLNKLQIRNLEKLRDTLLPKLMSGEVRVEL